MFRADQRRQAITAAVPGEPPQDVGLENLRRQESALILLNLAILAGIFLVHALLMPTLGHPSRLFFTVVGARFLMQTVELIVLNGLTFPLNSRILLAYSRLSVWLNVAFAFLISVVGGISGLEDSHYIILMVVPIAAAAFRFTLGGVAVVSLAAGALTELEVWLYFRWNPPASTSEYFEAANVVLFYVVVALIVWYLVHNLRREQSRLVDSLEELSRTRDRLVEKEKLAAVGRLAGAMAHEIRNPVAMIVSSLSLAREGDVERFKKEGMCDIVVAEAARLEKLTTDFLDYARVKKPEVRETSLETTVGYVAGIAKARAEETEVRFETTAPPGKTASFDPFQVHQALLNLVLNGIQATPPGGRVSIGAACGRDGGVRFTVENDAGPIPADVAESLFEPFFTTREKGTGLGLSVASNIARAHGGGLALAVNEPGRVRFDLEIPAPCNDGGDNGENSGR